MFLRTLPSGALHTSGTSRVSASASTASSSRRCRLRVAIQLRCGAVVGYGVQEHRRVVVSLVWLQLPSSSVGAPPEVRRFRVPVDLPEL
eukprot:5282788-Pyramimonas_sp.AAC.1